MGFPLRSTLMSIPVASLDKRNAAMPLFHSRSEMRMVKLTMPLGTPAQHPVEGVGGIAYG